MALITCPECSQQISDTAESCPKCGFSRIAEVKGIDAKKNEELQRQGVGMLILLSLVFLWAIAELSSCASFRKNEQNGIATDVNAQSKPRDIVENNSWDSSVSQVADWLKKNLKDPSSLEFIEWSAVKKVESGFVVRVKYRAKNGFGGYTVENKVFGLDLKGVVLGCQDFEKSN